MALGIHVETGSSGIIRYNIIKGTQSDHLSFEARAAKDIDQLEIYNNTFYNAGWHILRLIETHETCPEATMTNLVVKNNIFMNTNSYVVMMVMDHLAAEESNSFHHNLYYSTGGTKAICWGETIDGTISCQTGDLYYSTDIPTNFYNDTGHGTGSKWGNPLFVNAPSDLHLQSGSPAKGAGDDGGDMGAYISEGIAKLRYMDNSTIRGEVR